MPLFLPLAALTDGISAGLKGGVKTGLMTGVGSIAAQELLLVSLCYK